MGGVGWVAHGILVSSQVPSFLTLGLWTLGLGLGLDNSTFIVPGSYSSFSVPDLTEVETLTQEILNHGHEHFDKWNIFSVYHIQSINNT